MKIIGVIPARYKSTRFPGKPLTDINGKPMVWWVYNQAKMSKELDEIYVATDDERISNVCKQYEIPVVMTSESCSNGTERVSEVSNSIDADYYINIQGDEPLIEPSNIDMVAKYFRTHPDSEMATLKTTIDDPLDLVNNTITKIVCDLKGNALYLSRSPIPYPKGALGYRTYRHLGLYGYRKDILRNYVEMDKGPLEMAEDVEVLRFIEHGISVMVIETKTDSISVDTEKDVERIKRMIGQGYNA